MTVNSMQGNVLSGYYKFDDEGVRGQKVNIVENGVFKKLLDEPFANSRIQQFQRTRTQRSREQSKPPIDSIITSSKVVPMPKLREMPREEAKKQDKEFGLYFVQVQGGFTFTGRAIPNSFNVNPLLVYKIFADGSCPDEMVRGVDLIGTLTTFSHIEASTMTSVYSTEYAERNWRCSGECLLAYIISIENRSAEEKEITS